MSGRWIRVRSKEMIEWLKIYIRGRLDDEKSWECVKVIRGKEMLRWPKIFTGDKLDEALEYISYLYRCKNRSYVAIACTAKWPEIDSVRYYVLNETDKNLPHLIPIIVSDCMFFKQLEYVR